MNGKAIVARSPNQQLLVEAFHQNDLVFAIDLPGQEKRLWLLLLQ